ncbi:MAG: hypothetical protein IT306_30340 [Chloroflexi bacterium]|nr:hypothetical protein [Chloroflexota bacterium]
MLLLLLNERCSCGDPAHRPSRPRRPWREQLGRVVQQMAVYLGDAYLANEGCRGDILCAAPDYFEEAVREAERRRQ